MSQTRLERSSRRFALRDLTAVPRDQLTARQRGLELLRGLSRARGLKDLHRSGGELRHFLGWELLPEAKAQGRALVQQVMTGADLLGKRSSVPPVRMRAPAVPHRASVDIIICVHNALLDVQRCLESLLRHTQQPYALLLVDDGSAAQTAEYLAAFAAQHGAALLRSDTATGYTRAANRGLLQSGADHVVLLNSDTVVTSGWLDRLVACAEADERTGLVGPLSNTASWQSIPEVRADGDWADNPLQEGVSVDDMGQALAQYAGRLYPRIPFLNGFCLLIRRRVLDAIGRFDEESFGEGYGEENDYCLRARQAGFTLAVADDAYVYHAQSRSYSHERRRELCRRADAALAAKHDLRAIAAGVEACERDPALLGIRARSRTMIQRTEAITQGRAFAGKRVLMVLPCAMVWGGVNVVLCEMRAMRRMGVDACLFNLTQYRRSFERSYPGLDVPVVYGSPQDLRGLAGEYDALVATYHGSTEWLAEAAASGAAGRPGQPVWGYYIQDFEPYFYPRGSPIYDSALRSYRALPGLVRVTKTEWNRREIADLVGVDSVVIGPSLDVDLFRPRPRPTRAGAWRLWGGAPVRVAAMIRPMTPRRAPGLTMEVLRAMSRRFGSAIEIVLFGCAPGDPGFLALRRDFPFQMAGLLGPAQMAALLNEADVFVDFSTYQAMGLTAMEAMSCGAAVVVPTRGGAGSFAAAERNCLVVDTDFTAECEQALKRLIVHGDLRQRLAQAAIADISAFYPEGPALRILRALFHAPP